MAERSETAKEWEGSTNTHASTHEKASELVQKLELKVSLFCCVLKSMHMKVLQTAHDKLYY